MNILQSHERTLSHFHNIIKDVELIPTHSSRQVRFKVTFIDNTNLRISETFLEDELIRYSYYYLNVGNELIIGWDSPPHAENFEIYYQKIG